MTPRDQDWLEDAIESFDLLYFSGELADKNVTARWHRFRTRGRSTRFGDCDCDTNHVRINAVLAQPWVPTYFVLDVVYHELLHVLLGPAHGHAFRLSEARHVHHARAAVWEAGHAHLVVAETAKLCALARK